MYFRTIIVCSLAVVLASVPVIAAADTCSVARDVAAKAQKVFKTDKADGLRLFIKARQLCTTEAVYSYNLGIAYYQYGRLAEAEQYLKEAVSVDKGKASWQNNLAAVMLARGNASEAVKYARQAYNSSPTAQSADTLARAQLAKGEYGEGLSTVRKATKKWSSEKRLKKTYDILLDQYLAHYLKKVQSGQVESGLAGLEKIDFDAQGVRAYCLALASTGKLDEAIRVAGSKKSRFSELNDTFDELLSKHIATFYEQFQKGQAANAVMAAKEFAEQYSGNEQAQKAYDELLDALLADASTIEVPQPVHTSKPSGLGTGRSEQLLAGMSGGNAAAETNFDLTVDIDQNIPTGKLKRPNGVAVIIGNQRYARQNRGVMDVDYAERDALIMREYLIKTMGFNKENIIYRTNVTSGDMRSIFGSKNNPRGKLHDYIRAGKSEVFIYYVGHGAPGPKGTSAYLVPVDAEVDYIQNNGYDLDLFYQVVADLPAKEVTVVLDACFSGDSAAGSLFTGISPAMLKTVKPIREIARSLVFVGADKDQVVTWYPKKRHSLYTYFFLKGLGGAADSNGDKTITAGELGKYLEEEVPFRAQREASRKQNPLLTGEADTVMARL